MIASILRYSLCLLAGLLSGCASAPQAGAELTANYKNVGIISVVGSDFSRLHVGFTVFGNEFEEKNIANWQLDKEYELQLGAAVVEKLGAQIVRASSRSADFARLNEFEAFGAANWEAIEGASKKYCAESGADALVVAGRWRTGDFFRKTNQSVKGVGIYTHRLSRILHVLATVGVVDCRTGKPVLTSNLVRKSVDKKNADFPVLKADVPEAVLPKHLARASFSEWTLEGEQEVRRMVIELPSKFWADALENMLRPITLPKVQVMRERGG